jgi:hypothetical protein
MTTATPTKTAGDAVTAYANIHSRVYAPVFFNKLATDYGITPENDDECRDMLVMATKLRTAHDAVAQQKVAKTKTSRKSFLKAAHSNLDAVLKRQGLLAEEPPQADINAEIKAAAATLTLDPEISQSVLQLLAASR